MLTKRRARQIREGITAGRRQARFERQYIPGHPDRWTVPGCLNARDGAPDHFPGKVAYWITLGRNPSSPSNF